MAFQIVKAEDQPKADPDAKRVLRDPGTVEIENALEAMYRGHTNKALDLLVDGLNQYADHHDRNIPWQQ